MTELETIQHAKNYLDKMAQGIDPLTNEPIPDGDLLNNVRISRCLFFTSNILRQVIENGGVAPKKRKEKLPPFHIDYETLSKFPYSDRPIALTPITDRINELVDTTSMRKLSYSPVRKWLMNIGMLEEVEVSDGVKIKRPTAQGEQLGISLEHRINPNGREYDVILYNRTAQEFITDNLIAVLETL